MQEQTQSVVLAILRARDGLGQEMQRQITSLRKERNSRTPAPASIRGITIGRHLSYFTQALAVKSAVTFADYIAWVRIVLERAGETENRLLDELSIMRKVMHAQLDSATAAIATEFLEHALRTAKVLPRDIPSFLTPDNPYLEIARHYLKHLLEQDRRAASSLILDLVPRSMRVQDAYLHVFEPCQHEIGRLWQLNQITVAQEHYCTAATQLVMSQLYQHVFGAQPAGRTLVATCVQEDLHEVGIRIVSDFFELAGWKTIYLGANTPAEGIVSTLQEVRADVLAVSATMPYHVDAVMDLIQTVRETPDVRPVRILVGGYPFKIDAELWQKVGADGMAVNAPEAVHTAESLLQVANDV